MGRHGGGSRGGGRSGGGRSRGGSRSGGSKIRSSSRPFHGSVNRSYYDRHGRLHNYYTNDRSFGKTRGFVGTVFSLGFITVHMIVMMSAMLADSGGLFIGGKVNGNSDRIYIEDMADILTAQEENEIIELFTDVYDKTGMPVALHTDDLSWMHRYDSLEVYSEELYYGRGMEEDAMVILFTTENKDGFEDWYYDMYCGDDTIKSLPDKDFDKLLDNFQKSMSGNDLTEALKYSWGSIMEKLGKKRFNSSAMGKLPILGFYSIFYIVFLSDAKKRNDAYKYFKENPHELEDDAYSPNIPVVNKVEYLRECPGCGAPNDKQFRTCEYCGRLLTIHHDLSSNMRY